MLSAISPGEDDWLVRFAAFVADRGLPIDFVSRHAYSSGPVQPVPFGVHQTLGPASVLLEQFALPRRQLRGKVVEVLLDKAPRRLAGLHGVELHAERRHSLAGSKRAIKR